MAIDELLALYITGNATEKECQEALHWINLNPGNHRYFENLRDVYIASAVVRGDNFDPDLPWERVKTRHFFRKQAKLKVDADKYRFKHYIVISLRYAAVIILTLIVGNILFGKYGELKSNNESADYHQVIAPLGSKTVLILADGTKVWLNAGSTLRYPSGFTASTRNVYLDGEAYFNVARDPKKKFIVHTTYLDIKVLGTEFNVKAYPEEKIIETTLVKGEVTIEGAGNKIVLKQPVSLKPNQIASFNKSLSGLQITSANNKISPKTKANKSENSFVTKQSLVVTPGIDPKIYTSWKEEKWLIQGEELESLAVKLERRYDVKIFIKGESLKHYRFSGTLRDETLEQVLNIIKITAPIRYVIDKKAVVLEENKLFKKSYDKMLINNN